MSIEVRNVSKKFDAFEALNDVTLSVPKGELVVPGPFGFGQNHVAADYRGTRFSRQRCCLL